MSLYEVLAKTGRTERRFDFPYPERLHAGVSIYDSGTVYTVVSVKLDKTGAYDGLVQAVHSHSFRA